MRISRTSFAILAVLLAVPGAGPALADESRCSINWARLNLSPEQTQQIQSLEQQWNKDYMDLQPVIIDDQHKLTRLLSDPKSDPVEIMALQQAIARKKEQLRSNATANYLRKRQLLNEAQQHGLEDMMRQAVADRQRASGPGGQTEVMPDHIQYLIQRVRHIWTRNSD